MKAVAYLVANLEPSVVMPSNADANGAEGAAERVAAAANGVACVTRLRCLSIIN